MQFESKNSTITCPVCDSKSTQKKKEVEKYQLYHCYDCKLQWVPGVSDQDLKDFYDSTYYDSKDLGYSDYFRDESNIRKNALSLLKSPAVASKKGGTLLDVGCAYGFLLDEAKKLDWDVTGTEISENSQKYAKENLDLDVRLGSLLDVNLPKNHFDVITLIGSIEHLQDPVDYMQKIAGLLKPGGCLIVTTIDTKGAIPIYRIKPPEHLFYFTAHNLNILVEKVGLKTKSCKTYWKKYRLSEAMILLGKALLPKLNWSVLNRWPMLQFNIKLPTNEVVLIAQKPANP